MGIKIRKMSMQIVDCKLDGRVMLISWVCTVGEELIKPWGRARFIMENLIATKFKLLFISINIDTNTKLKRETDFT